MAKKPDMRIGSFQINMVDEQKNPLPPTVVAPVPEPFYPAIGRLIINWALMEQEVIKLTETILRMNDALEPRWRKRPFEKKLGLMLKQWTKFADGNDSLIEYMANIETKIKLSKKLRDEIAHSEILFDVDFSDHFGASSSIRFKRPGTKWNQVSPPYFDKDLQGAALAARDAAGLIRWLLDVDSTPPIQTQDILKLRSFIVTHSSQSDN